MNALPQETAAGLKGIGELAERIRNAARYAKENFADKPMELNEKLLTFYFFKEAYGVLDTARKELYNVLDDMDKNVIPEVLDKAGVADGVRIRISDDLGYNFRRATKYGTKVLDKERLYELLRERGAADIIQETVNSGTLTKYVKDLLLDEGIELPEDIVQLTSYYGVGVNTYTPTKTGD